MRNQSLSKVIFKFTSKEKHNECYKLLTKVFDPDTGEIVEKDSLITKEVALNLEKNYDIEIKDLDAKAEKDFEDYIDETEEKED